MLVSCTSTHAAVAGSWCSLAAFVRGSSWLCAEGSHPKPIPPCTASSTGPHVTLKMMRMSAGIAKLDDANDAGTKHSQDCTLILTEGDSAKTLAVAGLSVVGRDRFGVFPLRSVNLVHILMSMDTSCDSPGIRCESAGRMSCL